MVYPFVDGDTKLIKKFLKHFIEQHASEVIESTDNYGTVDEFREDGSKVDFLDIQLSNETGLE